MKKYKNMVFLYARLVVKNVNVPKEVKLTVQNAKLIKLTVYPL